MELVFHLTYQSLTGGRLIKTFQIQNLHENSQYALEGTKKQLYKNIQQAYADAVAALKKYNASIKQ